MTKCKRTVYLLLAALVVGLASVLVVYSAEPRYHGRKLTSWLQQCVDTPLMETNKLTEAQDAVRSIGAQAALPTLLRLVKTKDNPVRAWIVDKAGEHDLQRLHLHSTDDYQLQGIAGFEVLGTNCASAIGELTQLLDDKELGIVACRCLGQVGKAAEPALCRCLTNANWQVRELCIDALSTVTEEAEVYIERVKPCLADVSPSVRGAAVAAIAAQEAVPELVIPLLISALGDSDDSVCSHAAGGLEQFGTNAVSAFPVLTNLVAVGREDQATAALRALVKVAPEGAVPVLSNAVATGSATVMAVALGTLKAVAPDLALSMTLAECHSEDSSRQAAALFVAGTYDVKTPGIVDALKFAARSTVSGLAAQAEMVMRQMLAKEDMVGMAIITNEPSYRGKSLGEWLKMRQQESGLATNAVEALREMGTNVVPALLVRLTYRDPIFNLSDGEVSTDAVMGLVAIGERVRPVLPALGALMDGDDSGIALSGMMATIGGGVEAVPYFIKGMTNRFADVRNEAVNTLTQWGARFPKERREAIPYIVKLLNDPDEVVRINATNAIKEIDPQAAARMGVK